MGSHYTAPNHALVQRVDPGHGSLEIKSIVGTVAGAANNALSKLLNPKVQAELET